MRHVVQRHSALLRSLNYYTSQNFHSQEKCMQVFSAKPLKPLDRRQAREKGMSKLLLIGWEWLDEIIQPIGSDAKLTKSWNYTGTLTT